MKRNTYPLFILFFVAIVFTITENCNAQTEITIRVYPHVLREDDGSGGITLAQLNETKSFLNNAFNPHDIYFEYMCTNYIDNSVIALSPHSNSILCDSLLDYYNEDGIDMFIGNELSSPANGKANGILGSAFAVTGISAAICTTQIGPSNPLTTLPLVGSRSHLVSHEMAHCLGLYHTFETSQTVFPSQICGGYQTTGTCFEQVNGSNCSSCGDLVCDTAAEILPASFDPCTCRYNGTAVDSSGTPYMPDGSNIMSASYTACINHFTTGQANRIRTVMQGSPFLVESLDTIRCKSSLCCIDGEICIMDGRCLQIWSEHCDNCEVEWISPPTGGNNDCITMSLDSSFIYEVIVSQEVNGITFTDTLSGTNVMCLGTEARTGLSEKNEENILNKHREIVRIFPNPSTSEINLLNRNDFPLTFSVYSISGKIIQSGFLKSNITSTINIRKENGSGSYLIKLHNFEKNLFEIKKIIVLP